MLYTLHKGYNYDLPWLHVLHTNYNTHEYDNMAMLSALH